MALEITKEEIEGGVGIVCVESESMQEVLSKQARDMAWERRVKMGLSTAGLEAIDIESLDSEGKTIDEPGSQQSPVRWRRTFRLTPTPY